MTMSVSDNLIYETAITLYIENCSSCIMCIVLYKTLLLLLLLFTMTHSLRNTHTPRRIITKTPEAKQSLGRWERLLLV